MIEKIYYNCGEEGLRVWESGIVMARHYALRNAAKFTGEIVVELGSGTGVAGISLIKYT